MEELVHVKLSVRLGLGVPLEHCNKVTESISRLCFLTSVTLVSEVGLHLKKNTPYEDGDVKKLPREENFSISARICLRR